MSWAQRLKRVFPIDIETCERCGGQVKIIASLSDPALIARILAHLGQAPLRLTGRRGRSRPKLPRI